MRTVSQRREGWASRGRAGRRLDLQSAAMSAAATPSRSTSRSRYDERRPGAVRRAGLEHRRGADARLHERARRSRARARRGELHLWSRSRGEQWHKGATSGNVQAVRALRLDCDGDALLALVEPAGPACHTGERTCFHRGELEPPAPYEALPALERTLAAARARAAARAPTRSSCSTTRARIGEKVMEEAEEVARAAREESDERVDEEAADVALPPARAAAQPRTHARRRRAGARWPSLASAAGGEPPASAVADPAAACEQARELAARAQPHPAHAQLHRGLRDARVGVPEAARARAGRAGLPARVRRAGPARRALVVHRRAPRAVLRWSLADGGDPYALAAERVGRFEQAPMAATRRRSPAARSASSATTSCARSSRSASPARTRSGCPTWR